MEGNGQSACNGTIGSVGCSLLCVGKARASELTTQRSAGKQLENWHPWVAAAKRSRLQDALQRRSVAHFKAAAAGHVQLTSRLLAGAHAQAAPGAGRLRRRNLCTLGSRLCRCQHSRRRLSRCRSSGLLLARRLEESGDLGGQLGLLCLLRLLAATRAAGGRCRCRRHGRLALAGGPLGGLLGLLLGSGLLLGRRPLGGGDRLGGGGRSQLLFRRGRKRGRG